MVNCRVLGAPGKGGFTGRRRVSKWGSGASQQDGILRNHFFRGWCGMNRLTRYGILAASVLIVGWVGIGHVLGRTTSDSNAYKSLVVYGEVLQRIQNDYVDEPNMHLVTAGSLHGLLESLDSESSYLTPREYTEYQQKLGNPGTGETGLNLSKRFGYIIVTSVMPESSAEKAGLHSGDILESVAGFTTREVSA